MQFTSFSNSKTTSNSIYFRTSVLREKGTASSLQVLKNNIKILSEN